MLSCCKSTPNHRLLPPHVRVPFKVHSWITVDFLGHDKNRHIFLTFVFMGRLPRQTVKKYKIKLCCDLETFISSFTTTHYPFSTKAVQGKCLASYCVYFFLYIFCTLIYYLGDAQMSTEGEKQQFFFAIIFLYQSIRCQLFELGLQG